MRKRSPSVPCAPGCAHCLSLDVDAVRSCEFEFRSCVLSSAPSDRETITQSQSQSQCPEDCTPSGTDGDIDKATDNHNDTDAFPSQDKDKDKDKVSDTPRFEEFDSSECSIPSPCLTASPCSTLCDCNSVIAHSTHTLVLDLDETLVRCLNGFVPGTDFAFSMMFEGNNLVISVKERPYLNPFLEGVALAFHDVVLFTASLEEYAEKILNQIDPEHKYISKIFSRKHCELVDGHYEKDLRIVCHDLSKVVLVDNSQYSHAKQPLNGVLVSDYIGQDDDDSLLRLLPSLQQIASYKGDVRDAIAQAAQQQFSSFIHENNENQLQEDQLDDQLFLLSPTMEHEYTPQEIVKEIEGN